MLSMENIVKEAIEYLKGDLADLDDDDLDAGYGHDAIDDICREMAQEVFDYLEDILYEEAEVLGYDLN